MKVRVYVTFNPSDQNYIFYVVTFSGRHYQLYFSEDKTLQLIALIAPITGFIEQRLRDKILKRPQEYADSIIPLSSPPPDIKNYCLVRQILEGGRTKIAISDPLVEITEVDNGLNEELVKKIIMGIAKRYQLVSQN